MISQNILDDTLNTAAAWILKIEEQVLCVTLMLLVMYIHTYCKLIVRDEN